MALIFNIVDKHGHLDVGVIITVYNIRVRVVSDTTRPLMLYILKRLDWEANIINKYNKHNKYYNNNTVNINKNNSKNTHNINNSNIKNNF